MELVSGITSVDAKTLTKASSAELSHETSTCSQEKLWLKIK